MGADSRFVHCVLMVLIVATSSIHLTLPSAEPDANGAGEERTTVVGASPPADATSQRAAHRASYDLLVIVGDLTGDTGLDEYREYRESVGLLTEVVTLSEVYAAPTAQGDDPEKIKLERQQQ